METGGFKSEGHTKMAPSLKTAYVRTANSHVFPTVFPRYQLSLIKINHFVMHVPVLLYAAPIVILTIHMLLCTTQTAKSPGFWQNTRNMVSVR